MHLSAEEALDLVEERATTEQIRFWDTHMATCLSCRDQLEGWQKIREALKRQNLENAPDSLVARAESVFELPSERKTLREVLAAVVFDSFAQPALAGARGGLGSRQFLLTAEDFDIHLRLWALGNARRVTGQILSRGGNVALGSVSLHLLQDGKRLGTAQADEFGEFEFPEVVEGPVSLEIELPHLRITGELDPS
jgi:hypothetical protein